MMGELDSLYREVVLDHHRHPRGSRPLAQFDVEVAGRNPSCGDEVTLQVKFAGDRIAEVGVLSRGCAISTSSGSMLAEVITGRTLAEAAEVAERFKQVMQGSEWPVDLDLGDLEALQGVQKFPVRIKCALLPWVTLLDAILAHAGGRAPAPTPEAVLESLRPVKDPELNLSIVDLGLVRGVTIDDENGRVDIDLTLTSPMCPLGPEIMAAARLAAERVPGVTAAAVKLVWSPMWDPRADCSEDAKAELGIW